MKYLRVCENVSGNIGLLFAPADSPFSCDLLLQDFLALILYKSSLVLLNLHSLFSLLLAHYLGLMLCHGFLILLLDPRGKG